MKQHVFRALFRHITTSTEGYRDQTAIVTIVIGVPDAWRLLQFINFVVQTNPVCRAA
jgi:hypothetical protein